VNADATHHRLADSLRNLLYPLVPVIAVGTIWAIGWAGSLESRVASECGPLRSDSDGNVISLKAPQRFRHPSDPPVTAIASDDD